MLWFFWSLRSSPVLGFGGIAGTAAGIAKILFFGFLVLFLVGIVAGRRTAV